MTLYYEMNLQNNYFNILSVEECPEILKYFIPRWAKYIKNCTFSTIKVYKHFNGKNCLVVKCWGAVLEPSHPLPCTHSLKKAWSTCWAAGLYSGSHVSRAGGGGRRRPLEGSRPRQWPAPGRLDRSLVSVYRFFWWWITGFFILFAPFDRLECWLVCSTGMATQSRRKGGMTVHFDWLLCFMVSLWVTYNICQHATFLDTM